MVPPESLPKVVTVLHTYHDSACRPALVECDDGEAYVIKGSQSGKSAFNDNVVGRIANRLGMPVPKVRLVELSRLLIELNRDEIGHFSAGVVHAACYIPDCTEGWFLHTDVPENRIRYALLAFLYGWMNAAEKQFFYNVYKPRLVYSFDHDAFFPKGPDWNADTLACCLMTYPDFDDTIYEQASISPAECDQAKDLLRHLERPMIQDAIDATPLAFGEVGPEERALLCDFLWDRASQMLDLNE